MLHICSGVMSGSVASCCSIELLILKSREDSDEENGEAGVEDWSKVI